MDFGKDMAAHSPNELRLARESVEQDEQIKQLEAENKKLKEAFGYFHCIAEDVNCRTFENQTEWDEWNKSLKQAQKALKGE